METTIWDVFTFLWEQGMRIMNFEINALGLHFTLWQFAIGLVVVELLLYAVFRALD